MGPRRDWSEARVKIEAEGRCRLCSRTGVKLDAAHITGRRFDRPRVGTAKTLFVHPDSVIPLCSSGGGALGDGEFSGCHQAFDAGRVSILGRLSLEEQLRAVQDYGSLELARLRLDPLDYRPHIQRARAEVTRPDTLAPLSAARARRDR